MSCPHDYANPRRKGRAHYSCLMCGADITMPALMIAEASSTTTYIHPAGMGEIKEQPTWSRAWHHRGKRTTKDG